MTPRSNCTTAVPSSTPFCGTNTYAPTRMPTLRVARTTIRVIARRRSRGVRSPSTDVASFEAGESSSSMLTC